MTLTKADGDPGAARSSSKPDHRSGMDEIGYYIRTFTGKKLYWDRVEDHDYNVIDIAHSLASRVRWTGHVRRVNGRFWSIGQHSILVHDIVAARPGCTVSQRKQALMHDGSEGYMPDFPSPLKWWMIRCGNDELFKLEKRVDAAIGVKLHIQCPRDPIIKEADLLALATENRDFMPDGSVERNFMPEPLPEVLIPWGVERTEREFLRRWNKILKEETQ